MKKYVCECCGFQCDEIPEWKKDECPNSKPEGHYFICKEDIETRKRRR